jgi:hypothetical protein
MKLWCNDTASGFPKSTDYLLAAIVGEIRTFPSCIFVQTGVLSL